MLAVAAVGCASDEDGPSVPDATAAPVAGGDMYRKDTDFGQEEDVVVAGPGPGSVRYLLVLGGGMGDAAMDCGDTVLA
ncbi:hypothetical protein M4J06_000723 [Streptomyces coelicoflavus]|uniref:hypothetical protein n=1 Tax=Streptomyces coelicoflavus TaxID=285562 RepID=UPI002108D8A6|nr:hypothetical protein [Streptomyces coelicoflavus]MCQ4203340.1 hypothetical protein [Streptomyces coelicoflavus]